MDETCMRKSHQNVMQVFVTGHCTVERMLVPCLPITPWVSTTWFHHRVEPRKHRPQLALPRRKVRVQKNRYLFDDQGGAYAELTPFFHEKSI